jgi:hypothetical protein
MSESPQPALAPAEAATVILARLLDLQENLLRLDQFLDAVLPPELTADPGAAELLQSLRDEREDICRDLETTASSLEFSTRELEETLRSTLSASQQHPQLTGSVAPAVSIPAIASLLKDIDIDSDCECECESFTPFAHNARSSSRPSSARPVASPQPPAHTGRVYK